MFAYLLSLFSPTDHTAEPVQDEAGSGTVAHQLLESADSRMGLSAHQSQELREAASAYLSVVR